MIFTNLLTTGGVCLAIGLCLAAWTVPGQLASTHELSRIDRLLERINKTLAKALEADDPNNATIGSRGGWRGPGRKNRKQLRPANPHNPPTSPTSPTSTSPTSPSRSPTSCGSAPLNPIAKGNQSSMASYVVNGVDQIYGEWPSFARLIMRNADGSGGACGGTIVSNQHILTAAHCVYKKGVGMARSVTVKVGDHNDMMRDRHEKVYQSRSFCVPEGYKKSNERTWFDYDWAVITLQSQIQFTDYIRPACLPYGFKDRSQYKHCHLVGAGLLGKRGGTSIPTTVIQKIPVKQVSCAGDSYMTTFDTQTRACYTKAGSPGTSCSGDSGGPILCIDSNTNSWTVVASVSAGYCDNKHWVSSYSRTATLLPTIKAQCGI